MICFDISMPPELQTQSSDDEDAAAELEEVLKRQREKSKDLRPEDFGLGDTSEDETDREPTFEVKRIA